MSAFMLNDRHFAYLALADARYKRAHGVTVLHTDIEEVARLLKYENARSVAHLYPDKSNKCPACGLNVCDPHGTRAPEAPAAFVSVQTDRGYVKICPFATVEIPRVDSFTVELHDRIGGTRVTFRGADAFVSAVVLKQVRCYEHQANEHDEWKSSRAKEIAEAITTSAIAALPGYDAAPWGIS